MSDIKPIKIHPPGSIGERLRVLESRGKALADEAASLDQVHKAHRDRILAELGEVQKESKELQKLIADPAAYSVRFVGAYEITRP